MNLILGCDPGLGTTAAVLYDPQQDAVVATDSWAFGPGEGYDAKRVHMYCGALVTFIVRHAPVGILAIEDQQTNLGPPKRASGTRTLPASIQAAVGDTRAGNAGERGARAERGAKNSAMIRLAALRGALEQVGMEAGLQVVRVQPQQAKRALTGKPVATKAQMQEAANSQYGLTGVCGPKRDWPPDHVADALGIALAGNAKLKREDWHE